MHLVVGTTQSDDPSIIQSIGRLCAPLPHSTLSLLRCYAPVAPDAVCLLDLVYASGQFLANVNSRSRSRYVVVRPSVCLSSETFVHPTQAIEIFGNISTPFGTLAICDPSVKILRRSSQGNPSVGGVKPKWGRKCSDFGPFQGYISETVQGGKLLLITNRKSHMRFRLVPNSVTLNDLERRNRPNGCVISPNSVAFWADCVKVVEDTLILSAAEM